MGLTLASHPSAPGTKVPAGSAWRRPRGPGLRFDVRPLLRRIRERSASNRRLGLMARRPTSQALARAWGATGCPGCLSWGFRPLQHLRLTLRCLKRPCSRPSRCGVASPLRFFASRFFAARSLPIAKLHSAGFCRISSGPDSVALPAQRHSSPGSSRATFQTVGLQASRGLAEALCLHVSLRRRSWGCLPFAALYLLPGQRRRLRPAHPTCRFRQSPPRWFSARGRPQVSLIEGGRSRGFRRGSWVFPRYSAPSRRDACPSHERPKARVRGCLGLGLFQVCGHRSMRRRGLDPASSARPWLPFASESPSAHELRGSASPGGMGTAGTPACADALQRLGETRALPPCDRFADHPRQPA